MTVHAGEKQHIKEEGESEDEINPLDFMSSEFCEDFVESGGTSVESEPQAESNDCKETIKLEIKQEIRETKDLQDNLCTEVIDYHLKFSEESAIGIKEFKTKDIV